MLSRSMCDLRRTENGSDMKTILPRRLLLPSTCLILPFHVPHESSPYASLAAASQDRIRSIKPPPVELKRNLCIAAAVALIDALTLSHSEISRDRVKQRLFFLFSATAPSQASRSLRGRCTHTRCVKQMARERDCSCVNYLRLHPQD